MGAHNRTKKMHIHILFTLNIRDGRRSNLVYQNCVFFSRLFVVFSFFLFHSSNRIYVIDFGIFMRWVNLLFFFLSRLHPRCSMFLSALYLFRWCFRNWPIDYICIFIYFLSACSMRGCSCVFFPPRNVLSVSCLLCLIVFALLEIVLHLPFPRRPKSANWTKG